MNRGWRESESNDKTRQYQRAKAMRERESMRVMRERESMRVREQ